jgi:hypothetical protein
MLWLLAGCAGGERDLEIESSGVFPLPAGLEDEVSFRSRCRPWWA